MNAALDRKPPDPTKELTMTPDIELHSVRVTPESLRIAGKFPKLTTTLRAGVLATLLAGEEVPGMQAAFANGSKLATVIRALTRRYRWPIERNEFSTKTADGQKAWVSMYTLPAEVVASAFDHGAAAWIEEVHTARSLRLAAPGRRTASSFFGSNDNKQAKSQRSEP